jgi:transmembrane sensor
MTDQWWRDVENDPIHAHAAEWLARLESPCVSLKETIAWQQWMEADNRHAQAFTRMEELGTTLQQMPRPPIDADSGGETTRQRTSAKRLALAASLTIVVLCASRFMVDRSDIRPGLARILQSDTAQTAIGENRAVRLTDGSRVTLGGDTRLDISITEERRQITLSRGEAFFSVAKDPSRPFQVRTGEATVTAVGTAFNVRRGSDRMTVSVVEGQVLVEPVRPATSLAWFKKRTAARSQQLDAGQQAQVDEAGIRANKLPNAATATTWQSGRLTFRKERLRYVLEDVNRYGDKPIEVADEAIAELEFTGTVLHDNIPGWIHSLETVFNLKAIEGQDSILLGRINRPD